MGCTSSPPEDGRIYGGRREILVAEGRAGLEGDLIERLGYELPLLLMIRMAPVRPSLKNKRPIGA